MVSGLLGVFLRAVETTVGTRSPGAPLGARFGGYLDGHVHFHVLVTDGAFSGDRDGGSP